MTFENGSDSDCFIDAGHDSEVVKGQVGNYKKKVDVKRDFLGPCVRRNISTVKDSTMARLQSLFC